MCYQAGLGVAIVFGPQNEQMAAHVGSICSLLEIPHVELRPGRAVRKGQEHFTINIFPEQVQLNQAYQDLIGHFQWTKFCLMYSSAQGKSLSVCLSVCGHLWRLSTSRSYADIPSCTFIVKCSNILVFCVSTIFSCLTDIFNIPFWDVSGPGLEHYGHYYLWLWPWVLWALPLSALDAMSIAIFDLGHNGIATLSLDAIIVLVQTDILSTCKNVCD